MSDPVTITAPAPWTARPVPCQLTGDGVVVCPAGEVGRAVPVLVCGERAAALAVRDELRRRGYQRVDVEVIREAC